MPDSTYTQLLHAVTSLSRQVVRDADALRAWGQHIDTEAKETARISDQIGARRIDPDTVAETRQLSTLLSGLSQDAIAYASAGDNTAAAARAAHDQAKASHSGISEAVRASTATNIHDVDPTWLAQD
ncbi:hypothetical protein P1P75_40075 [Streptomyces sp. ID05-39B]|uniref:hypothetical protein n=1 Tax=Streptomyces sp. ID05-39B TaxID=3028664 RepID=UPI0029A408AB|nr:hypothetical protein [Streptomyces sp. ID05-39B]MDX3532428.1 hypothetical protein [Streptomyces sp. ID05-39B]MDX3532431.1 hypothetical protein [Streptomyces sp. ID05-39B]